MYIVTVTHTFEVDDKSYTFDNYEDASKFLIWLYNKIRTNEILDDSSNLDDENSWLEANEGWLAYYDGERTEFHLTETAPLPDDYPFKPRSDSYKVKELYKMLEHETNPNNEHYGANLKHAEKGNPLTIDAGGLKALLEYYSTHETNLDGDTNGN